MSDGEDFDWHRHADDIAVAEQLRIAVYSNPRGDIVIRQAGIDRDDDDVVVVQASNAEALARAILRAAGLDEDETRLGTDTSSNRTKDPTAAERMRRYRERNGRNGYGAAQRNGNTPLEVQAAPER
jgi:hypothetical protein